MSLVIWIGLETEASIATPELFVLNLAAFFFHHLKKFFHLSYQIGTRARVPLHNYVAPSGYLPSNI